jgi:hypothetical protein
MVSLGGSTMKRNKWYLAAVLGLAGLIVMPTVLFVNYNKNVNIAEGSPLPPPPPKPPAFIA